MTKHYTHLTQEERYQIYAYKKAKFSNIFIAKELRRHLSTIKRELARNSGLRGYRPQQSHSLASNRHQIKLKPVKMTKDMVKHIKKGLEQQWSPEQIQGRLLEQKLDAVCPKTIYDFIRQDKRNGGCLHTNLRHKKYKKRTGSPDTQAKYAIVLALNKDPRLLIKKYALVIGKLIRLLEKAIKVS